MMTESELLNIVDLEEKQSLGHSGGDLSKKREEALRFYNGELYGNEEEGRSQVVTTEVQETVEWILPSLLKIFTASDKAVEFEPERPNDEEGAQQATDTVNYVFYRQNDGFLTLYSFFKDALIQKNGYVKVWYEKKASSRKESYQGLTQIQLQMLLASEGVELLSATSYPDPSAPQPAVMPGAVAGALGQPMVPNLYDVQIQITEEKGKVCVTPIPPEEMRVSTRLNTVTLQDSPFTAHVCEKTISELAEMGFDVDKLDLEGYEDSNVELTGEWSARHEFGEENLYKAADEVEDPSMRKVWVTEAYLRVDYDGDGIAELRKVIKTGRTVLENEEVDVVPFAAITPIVNTHRHFGKSVAELVMDLQLIKSTLWRQTLDNVYLTNAPRMAVLSDAQGNASANLEDLLTVRPGGIVREYAPNAVRPLEVPFMGQYGLQMMEYTDSVRENRTGVTRYNQGADANSLNKTAHGISQIMSASQQRIELIARIFAETGVKTLFKLILHCLSTYSDKAMTIRLRDEFVEVDPRAWSNGFDMTINVGLGTGNKDQQLMHLQQIGQAQFAMLQAGLPIVTPENIYKAQAKIVENAGFKNVEDFWTDPNAPPDPSKPPPPPSPPDPNMIKAQQEQQAAQQKQQLEQARLQLDQQSKAAELQAEERRVQMEAQAKHQEMMFAAQLEERKQAHEAALKEQEMRSQEAFNRWKAELDAATKIMVAQIGAKASLEQAAMSAQENAAKEAENESKGEEKDSMLMDMHGATLEALRGVVETLAKPKKIVRDAGGKVAGIE